MIPDNHYKKCAVTGGLKKIIPLNIMRQPTTFYRVKRTQGLLPQQMLYFLLSLLTHIGWLVY